MKSAALLMCLSLPLASSAQSQVATNASCSNTKIDATGNVTFICSGLTPDQATILQNIPSLLTKMLKEQQENTADIVRQVKNCLVNIGQLTEGYWQTLSENQLLNLTNALQFNALRRPKPSVRVYVSNGQDHNRGKIAEQIRQSFIKAGWEAGYLMINTELGNDPQPVGVVVQSKEKNTDLAESVVKALGSVMGSNVVFRTKDNINLEHEDVVVHIWNRPD